MCDAVKIEIFTLIFEIYQHITIVGCALQFSIDPWPTEHCAVDYNRINRQIVRFGGKIKSDHKSVNF